MTRTRTIGAFVILLLAIALVAQEKSAPKSRFVISSPDAQLTAKVPEVTAALRHAAEASRLIRSGTDAGTTPSRGDLRRRGWERKQQEATSTRF